MLINHLLFPHHQVMFMDRRLPPRSSCTNTLNWESEAERRLTSTFTESMKLKHSKFPDVCKWMGGGGWNWSWFSSEVVVSFRFSLQNQTFLRNIDGNTTTSTAVSAVRLECLWKCSQWGSISDIHNGVLNAKFLSIPISKPISVQQTGDVLHLSPQISKDTQPREFTANSSLGNTLLE